MSPRHVALIPLALLLAAIEAAVIAAAQHQWRLFPLWWLYTGGFYALIVSLFALVWRVEISWHWLRERASVVFLGALWCGLIYLSVLKSSQSFKNRELAALLVTFIASGVALILARLRRLLQPWLDQGRLKPSLSIGVAAGLFGLLLWDNRAGFEQLNGWMVGMPLIAVVLVLLLTLLLEPLIKSQSASRLRALGRAYKVWIGLCVCVFIFGEFKLGALGRGVAQDGPWTSYLAVIVQRLTDFDHDDHSSWMGGMDCAPFDETISPDVAEIPGDGIDNNCIGGDGQPLADLEPPQPVNLPDDWLEKPNVLVITVEALRPDHIHALGYKRETTPNIDALIKESVVFEQFYAASTFTRQSLPALWTTRAPSQILWDAQPKNKMPRVGSDNPWVPELFAQGGYTTLGVQTDFPAFTRKDNIGLDRGFKRYNASFKLSYRGGTMRGFPAKAQADRAIELFKEFNARPFMMWMHMIEPHYMYEQYPGAPVFGQDDIARYDSEIWGVDAQIGRLVEGLKAQGLWDKTIIFITGDHGEEFKEHGHRFHGSNLYEPQVRTLGLLRVPGLDAKRFKEPVAAMDIGATLLNLAGLKGGLSKLTGRNLTAALLGEGDIASRPLMLEVWNVTTRAKYQLALVLWPYKLISAGQAQGTYKLFDLKQDPKELTDLWDKPAHQAARKRLVDLASRYLDSVSREYRKPEAD